MLRTFALLPAGRAGKHKEFQVPNSSVTVRKRQIKKLLREYLFQIEVHSHHRPV